MTDKKRRRQILEVMREHATDGTWVTCDDIELEGETMIDDESWGDRKAHSMLPAMLEKSYGYLKRHKIPTAAGKSGYEYMLVDERGDIDSVKDEKSNITDALKKLYHLSAFYEPIGVNGETIHVGDTIRTSTGVVHQGDGTGGKAVTGAELAQTIPGEDTDDCQKALSKLCQMGWLDRRKRYTADQNPYEYWLNGRGYEKVQGMSIINAMEW